MGVFAVLAGEAVAADAADASTEQPRSPVDLDACKVVMHLPGWMDAQAIPGGRVVLTREPWVYHDGARQRWLSKPLPEGLMRLRPLRHPRGNTPYLGNFAGLDGDGNAFFVNGWDGKDGQLTVTRVADAQTSSMTFGKGYRHTSQLSAPVPHWPYMGHDILCDRDGTLWVLDRKGLVRLTDFPQKKPKRIDFPRPDDEKQAESLFGEGRNAPYWGHQIYRFGDDLWVVRQMNSGCKCTGAYVFRVLGDQAFMLPYVEDRYVDGLVRYRGSVYLLETHKKAGRMVHVGIKRVTYHRPVD